MNILINRRDLNILLLLMAQVMEVLAREKVPGEQERELKVLDCKAWKPFAHFAAPIVKLDFAGKTFALFLDFDYNPQVLLSQWINR